MCDWRSRSSVEGCFPLIPENSSGEVCNQKFCMYRREKYSLRGGVSSAVGREGLSREGCVREEGEEGEVCAQHSSVACSWPSCEEHCAGDETILVQRSVLR